MMCNNFHATAMMWMLPMLIGWWAVPTVAAAMLWSAIMDKRVLNKRSRSGDAWITNSGVGREK